MPRNASEKIADTFGPCLAFSRTSLEDAKAIRHDLGRSSRAHFFGNQDHMEDVEHNRAIADDAARLKPPLSDLSQQLGAGVGRWPVGGPGKSADRLFGSAPAVFAMALVQIASAAISTFLRGSYTPGEVAFL